MNLMSFSPIARRIVTEIKFNDKQKLSAASVQTQLGCTFSEAADAIRELNKRFGEPEK